MTSFEIHVEKKLPPPVYKRYRKPRRRNHMRQHKHKREMQESKLDTLIRRTKEVSNEIITN